MLTYLFDASAVIQMYTPHDDRTKKAVRHIVAQKITHRQASLFIPNFCIAEVFNTLARKFFQTQDIGKGLSEEEYKKHLTDFRSDVHWGWTFYPYELNRYHIIAADRIIPAEHRLNRRYEHDHLSTFDILVIAMACELAFVGQREDTYLVTCDKRMKLVFEDLKCGNLSDLMVTGPLGELDERRWIPPNCLYLPEVSKAELRTVHGQAATNF